jgi:hypothetical protein
MLWGLYPTVSLKKILKINNSKSSQPGLPLDGCSEFCCGSWRNSSAAGAGDRRRGFPMAEDSGAILRHISSLKDMLDKVRNPPPPSLPCCFHFILLFPVRWILLEREARSLIYRRRGWDGRIDGG